MRSYKLVLFWSHHMNQITLWQMMINHSILKRKSRSTSQMFIFWELKKATSHTFTKDTSAANMISRKSALSKKRCLSVTINPVNAFTQKWIVNEKPPYAWFYHIIWFGRTNQQKVRGHTKKRGGVNTIKWPFIGLFTL